MKATALLLATLLSGCAPQLEGNYSDPSGAPAFRLAHGKCYRTNPDGSDYKAPRPGLPPLPQPRPYTVDGQRLLVGHPSQPAAFEILPDGRLKLSEHGHALIFVRK
ncbi:MAG TPA: hypothetical protein VGC21_18915 [Telluria sp.]|jgi:hypothetical protein